MDFAQAPKDAQVAALRALAVAALRSWSLEDAALALIKYRENAVFAVTAAGGARFVLRVHRPRYRSDAEIRSEVQWMAALAEAGVETPAAMPTRTGDVVAHAVAPGVPEPRQCDLLRFVPGAPLGTLEAGVAGDADRVARSYELIGTLAARIHAHGAAWSPPPGFVRPRWDADALIGESPTFGRFWELPCLDDDQRALLFRARDAARRQLDDLGCEPDHFGLLHGDLLPENILVDTGAPKLIDFDDCGAGWYGFELATGLFPLAGSPSFDVARDAYAAGYRKVRPLPEESLALLPTFLVARSLSYLGWPVGRPEMEEAAQLAPLLAALVTGLAERYLAGRPLGGT